MKKTLLALALLIGTSGAFAQIGIKADALGTSQKKAVATSADRQQIKSQKQNNLNGRKDGENMTLISDFSDATLYLSSTSIQGFGWNYHPNTTTPMGPEGTRLNTFVGINTDGYWFFEPDRYSIAPTADNGFMYLSMLDIWQAGMQDNDLEVALTFTSPLETYGTMGVDIYFNQYMMRFNSDRYFIDWSNDPSFATYDSIEFNTRGVEMDVNTSTRGTKRVTLPKGTYNASAVAASEDQFTYIRIRVTSPSLEGASQPHGYFLFLDDVYYSEVPEDRVEVKTAEYYANAYHIIPQGVLLDTLVSSAILENTGGSAYTDAQFKNVINALRVEGEEVVFDAIGENVSDMDTLENVMTRIFETNDAGVVIDTTEQRFKEFYAWTTTLPSEEVGTYAANSIVTARGEVVGVMDDTTTFRVEGPMVSNETHYRWAKDADRAVESSMFTYGWVMSGGFSYLTDQAPFGLQGYEVCLPYSTNANNETERWIKGIEVVPALDSCLAGSVIKGKLRMFNNTEEATYDNMIVEVMDEWGEPVETPNYELSAADLNNGLCVDPDYLDVITSSDENPFKTIYMEFPNSVRLTPGDIYYACYQMAETGKFAVATDNYMGQLNSFGSGNGYWHTMMLVFQPNHQSRFAWGGDIYSPANADHSTPMIRMILGTTASLSEEVALASTLNAYPNPANNSTTITYSLNKSGNVNIVITDIMGRTVKTMEQGSQVAGTSYNVNLNTSDLANGTYFYTLSVDGERQTKKFVVNR
ncbi:MAG: T9SS type A sorting domain-containing protein [Bacteroidales bacterium]|nr:T9SS type A sorting domain-containing protein [Bacteroidales bacterium]